MPGARRRSSKRRSATKSELALSIVDDVWPVLADPTDPELAIMNLAVNARDAMPRVDAS